MHCVNLHKHVDDLVLLELWQHGGVEAQQPDKNNIGAWKKRKETRGWRSPNTASVCWSCPGKKITFNKVEECKASPHSMPLSSWSLKRKVGRKSKEANVNDLHRGRISRESVGSWGDSWVQAGPLSPTKDPWGLATWAPSLHTNPNKGSRCMQQKLISKRTT